MIEHYALHAIGNITDRFSLTDGMPKGVKPRFNVSPNQLSPVIISSEGKIVLKTMSYGLVPDGAKDANSVFRYKTFNVKSEKVFSKPVWETAVRTQRCIIPMNGFYMQRSGKDGDVYYFSPTDNKLMAMAGIYTNWTNPSSEHQHTFALLTIDSNSAMPLPFARMPIILHSEDEASWLDAQVQDFSSLVKIMRPFEGDTLRYALVSNDVMSAKNDSPSLLKTIIKDYS